MTKIRLSGKLSPWYKKYTSVQPDAETFKAIRKNIAKLDQGRQSVATVVVIAHNEESSLLPCLYSLSENICDFPLEIIGIDNNSTDGTPEIFQKSGIRWYRESKKGPGHARQCGLNHAQGKYYISADADVIYSKHYISHMVRLLQKNMVVSTVYRYFPNPKTSWLKLKVFEMLRNAHIFLYSFNRPELAVRGGVMAFRTEPARKVGYRTDIKIGEDGSMALALKDRGKIKISFSRKLKTATNTRAILRNGTVTKHFIHAAKIYAKKPTSYFTKKQFYADAEKNKNI